MHIEASNSLSIIKNAMKNASLEARPVICKNCKNWSFFEKFANFLENIIVSNISLIILKLIVLSFRFTKFY